jgi:hypothetical protein
VQGRVAPFFKISPLFNISAFIMFALFLIFYLRYLLLFQFAFSSRCLPFWGGGLRLLMSAFFTISKIVTITYRLIIWLHKPPSFTSIALNTQNTEEIVDATTKTMSMCLACYANQAQIGNIILMRRYVMLAHNLDASNGK